MNEQKPQSVVKLNIGGYKYITTRQTLLKSNCSMENNFFTGLLSPNFLQDNMLIGDWIFIDRDGKYFECILEYLRTGDIVIPDAFLDSVLREAEFYGIKLPLSESSPHLMYITDEWLSKRKNEQQYNSIGTLADEIIRDVMLQFKSCASKGKNIESKFYLRDPSEIDNSAVLELAKTAKKQHETQDIKLAFLNETQKVYERELASNDDNIVNDKYFTCLHDDENRSVVIQTCKRNGLSITPKSKIVSINWKGTTGGWIVGYQFIHSPSEDLF